MSSALLQLETEIKDRLESLAFFADLAVLVEPRKNISAEIYNRIGKLKTLIVPKVVGADDNHPNVHGVYFDDIRIAVGVFQQPVLKGTHPDALEIAEEVHKALKNWTPASLVNAINPVKPGIEAIADKQLNIFNCSFATKGGFLGALSATADPVITGDDGADLVTITCSTPGAVIFYELRTDGVTANPTTGSTLYLEPFASPAENLLLKARAFMPGKLASKIVTTELNFTF